MTDAEVTINDQTEGASTANVDTESLVGAGGKTVQRQRVEIAGAALAEVAAVKNSAPTTEYGVVTRNIPSGTQTVSGTVAVTNANLDAAVSTLATQATLAQIKTNTDKLDVNLSTLEISEVTNAGTFAVQDSEKIADNGGFTDGTTKVLPIGYIYDEVAGTALTENDIGTPRMNINRSAIGIIEDGVTRGRYATVTASNALKVDGSAVTQPVSIGATVAVDPTDDPTRDNGKIDIAAFDVELPAGTQNIGDVDIASIAAGDNNIGNVDIVTMPNVAQSTAANLKAEVVGASSDNSPNTSTKQPTIPAVCNTSDPTYTNTNQVPLSVTTTGRLRCAVGDWLGSTAPTVGSKTSANSIPVVIASDQGAIPTVSTVTSVTQFNGQAIALNTGARSAGTLRVTVATDDVVPVVGTVADAASDSGNPVKIGAVGRTANRTAVTDGQRVNVTADDLGRLVVVQNQVRDLVTQNTTTISASTAETTILAQAASTFHDIVLLTIANTSASTTTRIDFRDTTGGSVMFSLFSPAGSTIGFAPPVPVKQTTVNTNWTAQCGTSTTDIRIFVQAVKNV